MDELETVVEMARSRNIKPGFFLNDLLAEVDPLGRLLFIGLWTIADRAGRLEDRPKKIKAAVLPYDNCDIDELLKELNKRNFIIRYEIESEKYIQITNWNKHQNPHIKEPESTIPALYLHSTSTIQEQNEYGSSRADSLNLIPDSLNLIPDSITEELTTNQREILNILSNVESYKLDYKKDIQLIRQIFVDFPDINVLDEAKKWAVYKQDKPLTAKANPRSQFRNWCNNASKWQKERGVRSGSSRPTVENGLAFDDDAIFFGRH